MKIRTHKPFVGLVSAFALFGLLLDSPVIAGGPVVESISGSGGFFINGVLRTFTFTAQKDADGNVSGQWTRVTKSDGTTPNHGEITCFVNYGEYVLVGGFTNFGVYSEPPNNGVIFWFADKDQGAGADPDLMTLQGVNVAPEIVGLYCANVFGPFFDPIEVTQGNVKVH